MCTQEEMMISLLGADAVYAALAHRLGVPLVTWDQEQIARVQTLIKSAMPETL
jgi:predicted nucleic acid-binding protein